MPYDKTKFRSIRHGVDGRCAYCRHCDAGWHDTENEMKKAIMHAKGTGHTIDIHREHWTEYTCYVKK